MVLKVNQLFPHCSPERLSEYLCGSLPSANTRCEPFPTIGVLLVSQAEEYVRREAVQRLKQQ